MVRLKSPTLLACLALAAAVCVAYFNALNVGFYGDDWIFYDLAGRLNLSDYLVRYFDPNAQTAWYRPVQGVLFRVEYMLWGNNPMPYHLRNVLLHLGNCFWLWAIVYRVTRNRLMAFVAALIFATLPTAAIAVFWPGVVDPMLAFFYLASVWFWLAYLQSDRDREAWLAFAAFLLALFSKEIGVTLPITLWLIDRLIAAKPASLGQLARRYVWFGIVWLVYFPIEYVVTRRSVFVNREGYAASAQLVTNLLDYLSTLAFPWAFIPTISYVFLLTVVALLGYVILVRKSYALIPPVVGAALAVLPVVPFPFVTNRFLYLSLVAAAILYAWLFDQVMRRLPRGWIPWHRPPLQSPKRSGAGGQVYRAALLAVLAGAALFGGVSVSDAARGFGENARIARVPFRNVRQAHPTLPADTFVYFLYPPVPGPNLSGMFLWYYGPRVFAGANDGDLPPRLRNYPLTYVQYFDESGNQKEQRVEKEWRVRITPALPVSFTPAIRLDQAELVSANVPRGDAVLLFLEWRALRPIVDDYTVGVGLVDANGGRVAIYAKEPRRGQSPTSTWMPGQTILDVIQLPVPVEVPPGVYRVEVALYDAAKPATTSARVIIEPVNVLK